MDHPLNKLLIFACCWFLYFKSAVALASDLNESPTADYLYRLDLIASRRQDLDAEEKSLLEALREHLRIEKKEIPALEGWCENDVCEREFPSDSDIATRFTHYQNMPTYHLIKSGFPLLGVPDSREGKGKGKGGELCSTSLLLTGFDSPLHALIVSVVEEVISQLHLQSEHYVWNQHALSLYGDEKALRYQDDFISYIEDETSNSIVQIVRAVDYEDDLFHMCSRVGVLNWVDELSSVLNWREWIEEKNHEGVFDPIKYLRSAEKQQKNWASRSTQEFATFYDEISPLEFAPEDLGVRVCHFLNFGMDDDGGKKCATIGTKVGKSKSYVSAVKVVREFKDWAAERQESDEGWAAISSKIERMFKRYNVVNKFEK